MSAKTKSRWADEREDAAFETQRKKEKEEKKRAKAEKQRALEEAERRRQEGAPGADQSTSEEVVAAVDDDLTSRPSKRRRLSNESGRGDKVEGDEAHLLQFPLAHWRPCRHVDDFEKLNHIEEGSYGWVSRARETATGEIVALKKLKMDSTPEGFPVTGLREIQTLMEARHPNVVNLREVVMGDTLSEYDAPATKCAGQC